MAREKACLECGKGFFPKHKRHIFCEDACKGKHKYTSGAVTTSGQYETISGNWTRYFSRLSQAQGRRENGVDTAFLLALYEEQAGLCALSGQRLTCKLARGEICQTNASIDKIDQSKGYLPGNVRLVCRIVNTMRWTNSDEQLVDWCRRIIEHVGT